LIILLAKLFLRRNEQNICFSTLMGVLGPRAQGKRPLVTSTIARYLLFPSAGDIQNEKKNFIPVDKRELFDWEENPRIANFILVPDTGLI
jgi:hypothetical protein